MFYIRSHYFLSISLTPSDERPDPQSFQDIPFIEGLFESVCSKIYVLRNETFVDQARRWTQALSAMTKLQPKTRHEWFLAADVTIMQFSALHSLALCQRRGIAAKTKQKYRLEYIGRSQDMQDAMLRYKRLQKRSTIR